MKSLGEVLTLAVNYLKEKGIESPRLTAELLLAHVLQVKRMDLYTNFECPLKEAELIQYRSSLKRASLSEPVEYITECVDFYGLCIPLSPEVLIPRPETEILVDKVVKRLQGLKNFSEKTLLDVCAGSGCIGLSLKKTFPEMQVILSDISGKALDLCRQTAKKYSLNVSCVQGDLLKPFEDLKVHYVVCNPPYVSESEYDGLAHSVKGFEPKLALVGGRTGVEFYEKLAEQLPFVLHSKGQVFLEIGHLQGEEVNKIFSAPCWTQKELLQDFAGKDRFFFLEIE
jgi:release factor glutamine methyltransferase